MRAAWEEDFEEVAPDGADPRRGASPVKLSGVRATPFRWRDPATIPTRKWLFGRHAIRRFVSLTVASGGTGKTALAIAESIALVTGKDLLRDHLMAPGRVWYIGLEDPLEEYERRVAAAALHYHLRAGDLEGGLFLDSGRDQDFIVAHESRAGLVIATPIIRSVIENIRANDVALVTVDPFVGCHALPESDNSKIAAVARQWAHIADETGAAIELVHHVRKSNGATELSADDARGASALVNAARSVRTLNPMTAEEAERAGVEERRRYFRLTFGKANLTLPAETGIWRELRTVSLGNGAGGPDDLVGVATHWEFPSALAEMTVSDLAAVQTRISQGEWRENFQTETWAGKAVAEVLGLDLGEPSARVRVRRMLNIWIKNGALKVVERPDGKRMPRKFVECGERAT